MDGAMTTPTKKKSAAAAAAHPPWVVLDRLPRLAARTARSHAGVAYDVTFEFHEPPRPSLCNLRRTLFAGEVHEVLITAINHTGGFIVSATEPKPLHQSGGTEPGEQRQAGAIAAPHLQQRFLFCDGTAGTARFLPAAPVPLHRASLGLLANTAGHHVVAALHHAEGAADATIFFCQPEVDNTWDQIAVAYPPAPGGQSSWNSSTIICDGTKLYWVHPALGMLCYNPFLENHKQLIYLPHPPAGSAVHPCTSEGSRIVNLSAEKVRCVQIEGAGETSIIKVWTLCCDSSVQQFYWKPGFEIPVCQLSQDEVVNKIRHEAPKIVCIHPMRPTVVFLSLGQSVFEVDLMLGSTVIHPNMPCYDQWTPVVPMKFRAMPWMVLLAPALVLAPTSKFRAILATTGNGPCPSMLTIDLGLSNSYRTNYCYISAVDSKSGSLLIYEQHERRARQKTWTFDTYVILYSDDSTRQLPVLPGMAGWHHNNAAIILNPSTGDTFVGLLHVPHQTLHFWTSGSPDGWKKVSASIADIPVGYSWTGHGAHALDASLYWLDLRLGFLTCNPFTERKNQLEFISFPEESILQPESVELDLNSFRCVNASLGSIRFVEMNLITGFPFVKLWSLVNDSENWIMEYTVDFRKLNNTICSPGFVHPEMSKIYFFQDRKAVAVGSSEMIEEETEFKVATPPKEYKASLVHVCNIPIQNINHFPAPAARSDEEPGAEV